MPDATSAGSGLQDHLTAVQVKSKKGAKGRVEFGVNTKNATDAAHNELLGKRSSAEGKRKTVVLFRDPTSRYRDSIRVETPNGELVGWIYKNDSKQAGKMLDTLAKGIRKSKRSLRKQSFAFHLTALVEGSGTKIYDVTINLRGEVDVDVL